MKISEAIKQLTDIKNRYGDLLIEGGYILDETPPKKFIVIDIDGVEVVKDSDVIVSGVFIE